MKGPRVCLLVMLAFATPAIAELYLLQPLLVDADQQSIGIFTGPAITRDTNGVRVRAFGLLSSRGYLAAVRPGGELGSVEALYFKRKDCQGTPSVLAQSEADVTATYLPGFVFTFGDPAIAYSIPKGAAMEPVELQSRLISTASGTECISSKIQGQIYSAMPNDYAATAIPDGGYSGVTVKAVSIREQAGKDKRKPAFPNQSTERTPQAFNFSRQADSCAPGCDSDMLANGYCEAECSNKACGYDANDCSAVEIENAMNREAAQCAPACEAEDLGDGFCDRACNNSACEFDQGDCSPN